MRSLTGRIILVIDFFFSSSTLNISSHSILACRVSTEKSTGKCMGFPWYVICCFSLVAFNILSLCLIFVSLISMCLNVFLLVFFFLYGTLNFLELIEYFLSHAGEVFNYNFQNFSECLSLHPLGCI